jgi:PAS domain-containing protein
MRHDDNKQIVWKCVTIQIFVSDSNKYILIQEEIKRRLNFGSSWFCFVQNLPSSRLLSKSVKIRMYTTIALPMVLYWCETWSLILKEEHRVFENRALRRIFGLKRDEVTGRWRKLDNEEFRDLYSSPSTIIMIKSRRMRWAGHVARMGEKRTRIGYC